MSAFDTHSENLDDDSQTLHSQRLWKAAGKQDLDFDSQRLRNRLRAKMFGVDASPVKIGRFAVLETVGSGGMGVVYAAYDEELDRRVAVKLLQSSHEEDSSIGKGRLLREAQALAKLSHPNVVQVYEVGTFDDRVFLAMEFLSGSNLRTWLLDEPHPWPEVLRHFIEAGEGLAAAHREGIIHRDFKPANLLFGGDGRVRVVDFGLARASELARLPLVRPEEEPKERALSVELTQTGEIMGTPAYMAPEQARYEGVDARSDQYSYCVALYEALFGRRPHIGRSSTEILVAVAEGQVASPPRNTKVPARIVRAVMRGLSVDPADRHPSMEALLAELSPREHGRWRLMVAGSAVVAGLGVLLIQGRAECPSFKSDLAAAWGPERRAVVESAFAGSGAPGADAVATGVSERLDTYASEWLQSRREICEAHQVRAEQSAQLHDRRVACLLERQVELATLTEVFAEADAAVVEQAPRAVAELSALAECDDIERMSGEREDGPVHQQLREMLAGARAQYKAGRYDQALERAGDVAASAQAENARGVEAAARLQQALIQERRRAYGPAAQSAEQALDLAEAAKDDELAARAWSRLARYQARLGEVVLADQSVRRAQAKVRRLDDEPSLSLDVRESQALVAWKGGRHGEAIEHQMAVVEQHLEQRGDLDPRTADAERRLANMLGDQGRHDEAQVRYQGARDVLAGAYGPNHPMVAHVLVDAAIDHRDAGRHEDARIVFIEAERLFIAALGPDAPALAAVHRALADMAQKAGDLDEAESRAKRLLDMSERPQAPVTDRIDSLLLLGLIAGDRDDSEQAVRIYSDFLESTEGEPLASRYFLNRISARVNLGTRLLRLGRISEAEIHVRDALTELERLPEGRISGQIEAYNRAGIWLTVGGCAEARGESAVDAYEQGLQSWSEGESINEHGRFLQAKLQWGLARDLRSKDPERALALAEKARPQLNTTTQRELDAWVAALPRRRGA